MPPFYILYGLHVILSSSPTQIHGSASLLSPSAFHLVTFKSNTNHSLYSVVHSLSGGTVTNSVADSSPVSTDNSAEEVLIDLMDRLVLPIHLLGTYREVQ